jgi:3-deoxy-D-manno-octulosonic-acid transferase
VSTKKVLRLSLLSAPAYASLTQVLAQTKADAVRFGHVGAHHIKVLGNLKFDAQPEARLLALGKAWKASAKQSFVVLLASSREGEELAFLQSIKAHPSAHAAAHSAIQWLIVPRHPQRFAEVKQLCEDHGLRVSSRSDWKESTQAADIWLGDSMSEMTAYYALADVALLGGSFGQFGGQNLMEGLAAGCPIVMGPHTYNFAEASSGAERIQAAIRIANMSEGVATATRLATMPSELVAMQDRAKDWLMQSRGAASKTAQEIALLIANAEPPKASV